MTRIEFRTTNSHEVYAQSTHRTNDHARAFALAVSKHWGRSAWFQRDNARSSETRAFGQVVARDGSTLTPVVYVDLP
jgi:hypothetical protein